MKRILAFFLSLTLLLGLFPDTTYAAPEWPSNVSIAAEGGILMDADSGAVLYGKNLHTAYYPASITKILTALLILENCEMDEIVTFSHNAVYNVESGSSSAGLDEGDTLNVRDCLYALMLKSANEVANALAEHAGGSIENFAVMMNEKAASLGCVDSHFNNPSGLNDENHYTSAYDMALIAQAAFSNPEFVKIASTLYYDIPPTKRNPEGIRVYPGHKMLKKNSSEYYADVIGGKTGYTSLAGNTLVTCAERDGQKLITVILNGHQTHYSDTRTLLNFGFKNFQSVYAADYDTTYTAIPNDMSIAGLPTTDLSVLEIDADCKVSLPNNAEFRDAVSSITYDLPDFAPDNAVAYITYDYNGRTVGSTYLLRNLDPHDSEAEWIDVTTAETTEAAAVETSASQIEEIPVSAMNRQRSSDAPSKSESHSFAIPRLVKLFALLLLTLAAIGGGLFLLKLRIEKREEAERVLRYQKRKQRLDDMGISATEFDLLMQNRRNASDKKHKH